MQLFLFFWFASKIFHAKETTSGHQIATEVTGEWLNILLVRMTSHQ